MESTEECDGSEMAVQSESVDNSDSSKQLSESNCEGKSNDEPSHLQNDLESELPMASEVGVEQKSTHSSNHVGLNGEHATSEIQLQSSRESLIPDSTGGVENEDPISNPMDDRFENKVSTQPKQDDENLDCEADVDKTNNGPESESGNVSGEKVGLNDSQQIPPGEEESLSMALASSSAIEENPAAESKESLLEKLASRGAISITASAASLPSTSVQSEASTSSQDVPRHKSGPKSVMMKRKAKKVKIDPGKSMDIDKDFDAIISVLASKSVEENDSSIADKVKFQENQNSSDFLNDKYMDLATEPELHIIDSVDTIAAVRPIVSNDKSIFGTGNSSVTNMDVDTSDDRSFHETDSESHDGSKSVSYSSDVVEENDEKISTTTQKLKNVIEEGSAEILLSATKNVFYNKVQEFNRDMSIAALTVFSEMHQQDPRTRNRGKKRKAMDNSDVSIDDEEKENVFEAGRKSENGITILEALSATGLRSIRYAREVPGVKEVIANDLSQDAVDSIKKNIEHNGVEDMVTTSMSDASLLMYQRQASQEWYDSVDLDPYGCPSRFLDGAVQAVRDGGLLLVTCTDMAILAGNSPESCYVKYGAVSLRSPACHEMALRIALQCIESHANRYGRYIVPLLSFSADFYIRVIVQVYTSPVTCKKTTSKLSMVYQCVGCSTFTLQPLGVVSQTAPNTQAKFSLPGGPPVNTNCFHCNHKHYMGGPIWSAPIYCSKFVERMLGVVENGRFGTAKRMQGMLEVIREELHDAPLYYTIASLCTKLHCQAIPLIDIRSAILNTGYRVSSSHAAPTAIKTNAPTKIIWDIMRCWVHMNPVSQKRLVPGSVPAAIILEAPGLIANFDIHPKARPSSSMRRLLRYQPNPEKNWGPGMRARVNVADQSADEKRKMNQNKNKTKKNVSVIEVVTIDDEDEVVIEEPTGRTESTSVSAT